MFGGRKILGMFLAGVDNGYGNTKADTHCGQFFANKISQTV